MVVGKYYFLCEYFNKQILIYAIKSSATNWHYFEEKDSIINTHFSLPADLWSQMAGLKNLVHVPVDLDSDQVINYVTDGKFVFKEKELQTYIQLAGTHTDQPFSTRKKVSKTSDDLVFAVGKSNPAVFLSQFEKCDDMKTDKDKLFTIRNFVNHEDKRVFSELFFKSDWSTARSTFLKKYSLAFTKNKKTELEFTFNEETSLRSFVLRKMKALSTYTRLSLESQLEIILNELPFQVSNLFIVHDKMNCTKTEILEFCDTIQEIMEDDDDEPDKNVTLSANPIDLGPVIQDLEVFDYDSQTTTSEIYSSEVETSDLEEVAGKRNNSIKKSAKRSRSGALRGRPSKNMKIICDENDDDQSTSSYSNC